MNPRSFRPTLRGTEFKSLHRKLERALGHIGRMDDVSQMLETILEHLCREFEGELGFEGGRIYEREGDDYVLRSGFQDQYYLRAQRIRTRIRQDFDRAFAEVGEGNLDWPVILEACDAAGCQHYLIEQDVCRRPPLESLRISLEHLHALGLR